MVQQLFASLCRLEALQERTVVIALSRPFGLVPEALVKIASNVSFIIPEEVAITGPFEQINNCSGYGPYVFLEAEWQPETRVVRLKFEDCGRHPAPASGTAEGKDSRVDNVVWTCFPN